jgi:YVTN family beta-propeller protein
VSHTPRRAVSGSRAVPATLAATLLVVCAALLAAPTQGGTHGERLGVRLPGPAETLGHDTAVAARSGGPRPAVSAPVVQDTIVDFNGSLVGGNFAAGWTSDPVAVAVDTSTGDLFVAAQDPYQLSVLHPVPGSGTQVVSTVPLPAMPADLVYDPADGTIYVTEETADSVAAINGTTLTVAAQVPVGSSPEGIALDNSTGDLYVANSGSNNVSVIDGSTNQTIVPGIALGTSGPADPEGIAFDNRTDQMFIAESSWPSHTSMPVVVLDDGTNTVVTRVDVGEDPVALAYDPSDGEMFVANEGSNNISAISDSSDTVVLNSAPDYLGPDGIAFLPSVQDLDVANGGSANVSTLDPDLGTVLSNTTVGNGPDGIVDAVFNGTTNPIVASYDTANVSILGADGGPVDAVVRLGQSPQEVAYDPLPGQHELFVAEFLEQGTVSVVNDTADHFDPDGLTSNIPVGELPAGVVFDPTDQEAFVSNSGSDSVSVIWARSNAVVATVPVGSGPWGLAWDNASDEVWVVNSESANVSVIDAATNTVVETVPLPGGSDPRGIAYDTATNFVYVTELTERQVALINASTFAVTAVGSGLGGSQAVYDSTDHLVYVSNGVTGNVTAYAQSTGSNAHVVADIAVPDVPDGLAYDAATDEVFVSEETGTTVEVIQPSSQSVQASVTVGSDPVAMAVDTGHQTLYVDNDLPGTTSIASIPPVPPSTSEEFDESGLPSGATWYVNISGQTARSSTVNGGDGASIVATLPVGDYTFSAATSWNNWTTSAEGGFEVEPLTNPPISVVFTPVLFEVEANETGLPAGAVWYFNVTGGPSASTPVSVGGGNETVTYLQNGSYSWTIATNWKNYSTASPSGMLTVDGAPENVTVRFSESTAPTYAVTFDEVSLTTGVTWYLNLSGEPGQWTTVSVGGGRSITFDLPDGSYTFAASTDAPTWTWNATLSGTSVTVAGAPLTVSVYFEKPPVPLVYEVEFSETGLPPGTNFTVVVDGRNVTTVAPATLIFDLTNGSYPYSVWDVLPYLANNTGGTLLVRGQPETVAVSFTSATAGPPPSSPPWPWIVADLGLIALALLALFGFVLRRTRKGDESGSTTEHPLEEAAKPDPSTDPRTGRTTR